MREFSQVRVTALRDALAEIEYLRDHISHPHGRRAYFIDSQDVQRIEAFNDAWDAINTLLEKEAF